MGLKCWLRHEVPFEEDDAKTWFLDHNYVESMRDMFKKINARERIVGWYHTGPRLRSSDLEINEVVKRYVSSFLFVLSDSIEEARCVWE